MFPSVSSQGFCWAGDSTLHWLSLYTGDCRQIGHKEFQSKLFQVLKLKTYVNQSSESHSWTMWKWSLESQWAGGEEKRQKCPEQQWRKDKTPQDSRNRPWCEKDTASAAARAALLALVFVSDLAFFPIILSGIWCLIIKLPLWETVTILCHLAVVLQFSHIMFTRTQQKRCHYLPFPWKESEVHEVK